MELYPHADSELECPFSPRDSPHGSVGIGSMVAEPRRQPTDEHASDSDAGTELGDSGSTEVDPK
jgi:hypothetical protein